MKDNLNKTIRSLYLTASENRRAMLSDLIENILYYYGEPLSCIEIIELIKTEFHLEPLKYEIEEVLETSEEKILVKDFKYDLTDEARQEVFSRILINEEMEKKREESICGIICEISDIELSDVELKIILKEFNSYLHNCFLQFGRSAIDIFLPYKTTEEEIYENQLKLSLNNLNQPVLESIFKHLVKVYPQKISKKELDYLEVLSDKAEKFFSLGLEEKDYQKIKEFNISDIVIFLDTNILYSILDLNDHPEDLAIKELVNILVNEKLDIKFVYLPSTLNELNKRKPEFDKIPRTEFSPKQLKTLLSFPELDSFCKKFFEKKLQDSEALHPLYLVQSAQNILLSRKIRIYNHKFPHLEDDNFLESRINDYISYETYINSLKTSKGLPTRVKHESKVEHDIILRESIINLRKEKTDLDDFKFIGLTLDNSLINYDRYDTQYKNRSLINPNFLLPSIFLQKIKSFLPLQSDNYKRSFVSSITVKTVDNSNPKKSKLIVKSMSLFQSLGIENEEVIFSIIKKDMFFSNFEEKLNAGEGERFIESELNSYISTLEKEKLEQEKKFLESEMALKTSIETISSAKSEKISTLEEENEKMAKMLSEKESNIFSLSKRLESIETELEKQKEEDRIKNQNELYLQKLREFQQLQWEENLKKYRKELGYFMLSLFLMLLGFLFSKFSKEIGDEMSRFIPKWLGYTVMTIVVVLDIIRRTIIIDKSASKETIQYYISTINQRWKEKIKASKFNDFELEYKNNNPSPKNLI